LYTFGFPWRPWKENTSIAKGELIIDYMKESANATGIDKKIFFQHHVDAASYSSDHKTWTFNVTANGSEKKTFRSRFFLMCTGYYNYNEPLQTEIPGIDNFKGKVVHPQFWPQDLDYTEKNVTIIGSGATAVTLLPAMTEKASHVTILQRSPSYLLSTPSEDGIERAIRKYCNEQWQHKLIRWKWLLLPFLIVNFCYYFPVRAKKLFMAATKPQLPAHISHDPHFTPSYNPFEQRVCFCPDADFYKALRSGKGSIETGVIDTITSDTIKLKSGKELHPDVIVTATGLKLRVGGGIKVLVDDKPYNVPDHFVWKGIMLEDLPNCAFVIGYVDASWTLGADATAQMVCRMLKQMDKEGVVEVVPRRTQEEKASMQETPLLRLSSTYIRRAKDILPKAGDRGQWKARSYYFKDILMAWFGDIKSGTEWVRGV
jgi:cation diffusion facilitator CzcD-associated flavoprotein CzcO